MFENDKFVRPDPAYGIHPFWFWNGEMNDDEIKNQIIEMADKGVTGFFICARQGMSIPYLSDEWFKKVNYAIEVAREHNLNVWLYDEYPYPSGIAGGEVVLEHADAKHRTLSHHVGQIEGGNPIRLELPWGKVLSAKAVPINIETNKPMWEKAIDVKSSIGNLQAEPVFQKAGLTAYTQKRYFTYRPKKYLQWTAPDGLWEIHCFLEVEIKDFKYYGTYVDPCHAEAMATFIHTTHERYAETLGQHFGKTVKGIFTDETHLLGRYPWSPQIIDFIKDNYGYDITDYLHLLVHAEEEQAAKVRYHYFQAIHLLLRQAYHKQIHDWCERNKLEYIAEVPSARMSTQLYSHVPGGDSAHEKLGRSLDWILKKYFYGFRKNPKMISSLSNQLGRERALIESFHSLGWSMTLQDAKWMIDRLAAFGINFFNFHAFFYTIDAMVKHDAAPSQFLQNPYWKHYRLLGDYTARMGYIMSEGSPVRSIAVLDPTTSLWTHVGNPFNNSFVYIGKDEEEKVKLEQLKQHWSDICLSLTTSYRDYDHLDPELLDSAEIEKGMMRIGKACYTVLILPPITNLEGNAWKKIKAFLNNGGTVIANGLLPYEVIEEDDSLIADIRNTFGLPYFSPDRFWQGNSEHPASLQFSKGEQNAYFIHCTAGHSAAQKQELLFNILEKHLPEDIKFKVDDDATSFLMQHRKYTNQTEVIFISNQEGNHHQTTLLVNRDLTNTAFAQLDLETGTIEEIQAEKEGDMSKIVLDFAPYQSHLIQIKHSAEKKVVKKSKINRGAARITVDSSGPWQISPLQDNVIRFNTFQMKAATSEDSLLSDDLLTGEVQAKTFIDQCEDLAKSYKFPLQFSQTFGTPMKVHLAYPIHVSYQTDFSIKNMPSQCSLLMDRSALSGELQIIINGTEVEPKNFQQKFVYDHNNLICDIHALLVPGMNTIQVKGQVHHDWDGLVDSLYIIGDFGVAFDETLQPMIVQSPTMAQSLIGPYQGLPYYAGDLSFRKKFTLEHLPDSKEFLLTFDHFEDFHECAEVMVNGYSLGVKAWSPYQWSGKSDILLEGENIIEVKVTNTLIGLLEGKYFNYQTHEYNDVRTANR